MDTFDCFEAYDRRFASACSALPVRRPWLAEDREQIAGLTRRCLGIRPEWIPGIAVRRVGAIRVADGMRIERLRSESWPGVTGAADLYMPPTGGPEARPFVLLCCGHGEGGKRHPAYQRMARAISRAGAIVLVPDNIGQGERTAMGHADCVVPFACGTSVQGLIVMETIGWLRWARGDSRIDAQRMAVAGNSGGGTLAMLLGALCPELAAVSSSGYPSTFEYVARKEKKHCHCNILPGVVGKLEMWHLLGCVAPRPLCIFQGSGDPLFPDDLFRQVARKVRQAYRMLQAEPAFRAQVVPGGHGWDAARIELLTSCLREVLNLPNATAVIEREELPGEVDLCLPGWPENALTTDQLARQLTGRAAVENLCLWDVFAPDPCPERPESLERGDSRQILAQFEAFLETDPGR